MAGARVDHGTRLCDMAGAQFDHGTRLSDMASARVDHDTRLSDMASAMGNSSACHRLVTRIDAPHAGSE